MLKVPNQKEEPTPTFKIHWHTLTLSVPWLESTTVYTYSIPFLKLLTDIKPHNNTLYRERIQHDDEEGTKKHIKGKEANVTRFIQS